MTTQVNPTGNDPAQSSADEGWWTSGRFAIVLGLLVFLMFPQVLLGTRTFVFRDYSLFSYPVAFFHRQTFWRGELPLWNPLNYCGIPFLAQWNTMTLYPGSLIYLILPMPWSLSFFCLLHLFWGGLGMYFLARDWTRNGLAGALAGVIFSFNGLMLNFLMWPSHIATFSWLPWILWLVPMGWRDGGRKLVLGVLAASMQMLAGGPETIFLTWTILFVLMCGDWLGRVYSASLLNAKSQSRKEERSALWSQFQSLMDGMVTRRRLSSSILRLCAPAPLRLAAAIPCRCLGMGTLVALICAAQLLPFLELLAHSQRDSSYAAMSHDWSIPFWGWANFLVPLFRTSPTRQGVFLQNGQYWTSSYYIGIGTLLLVVIAMRYVKDWKFRLMAALGFFTLLLAWGDGTVLYQGLQFLFPGIGFLRYPVKFVILTVAVAPLLAAYGLASLNKPTRLLGRFELICAGLMLASIAAIVAVDWRASVPEDVIRANWQNGLSRAALLCAAVTLIWVWQRARPRIGFCCGLLLLGLFWLDLATHVPNQNPTVPAAVYSPQWARNQVNWRPEPELGGSRLLLNSKGHAALKQSWIADVEQNCLRNRLAAEVDLNMLDGLPHADGFFSLVPRESYDVADLAAGKHGETPEHLLDFMGVSQVTAPGTWSPWIPRQTAMPMVSCGQRPVFADRQTILDSLRRNDADLRQIVFLPFEAGGIVDSNSASPTLITNVHFANHRVSFETEATAPTIVVLAQTYYPGWKAYVDGHPVPIWRANYAFQALQVPAGRHQVRLAYLDGSFRAGMVLSCMSLGGCLAALAWFWAKQPSP